MRVRRTIPTLLLAVLPACSGPEHRGAPAEQSVEEASDTEQGSASTAAGSMQGVFPFVVPYEVEAPCEYCLNPIIVCATIEGRARDHRDAPVVAVHQAGDSLTRITGRIHVVRPGLIVFGDTLRLSEVQDPRTMAPGLASLVFQPGDTIYVLTYGSEGGEGDWWYRGEMRSSDNVWMVPQNLEQITRDRGGVVVSVGAPDGEWWIKVRDADGREGWVLDDARSVRYGNHFDPEIPPCPGDVG